MRRSRRLSEAERWELGLFLTMLTVGCLALAAIFHLEAVPRLFASVFNSNPQPKSTPIDARPALSIPPTIFAPALLAPLAAPPALTSPGPRLGSLNLQPSLPSLPSAPPKSSKKPEDIRWYKGVAYKYVKTLKLQVTAYAPDSRCCWPYDGKTTASGLSVKTNHGKLVAADTNLIPMHALVSVPGYSSGAPVPVLDKGGAIKGRRLDVLLPTFDKAKHWGTQTLEVRIYMPVEN